MNRPHLILNTFPSFASTMHSPANISISIMECLSHQGVFQENENH